MPASFNEKILYETVGFRIKDYRKKKKLTQAELAERANLKRTSITHIEKGRQNSPLHVVLAICHALEIEIADLVPKTEEFFTAKVNNVIKFNVGTESKYVLESIAAVLNKIENELEKNS